MKQVVTKQGKTFDYSEILLFNRVDDKIVVMLNDKEQIAKFSLTGNSNDAPIAVIPYSEQELKEIISTMKQIGGYTELVSNRIVVEYLDNIPTYNTRVAFDSSNKEIIENNLIEQRKAKERNAVGNWYDAEQNKETSAVITEEQRFKVLQIEKYEEQENEYKKNANNSRIIAALSALMVVLGISIGPSSAILFTPSIIIYTHIMSTELAKKAEVSLKKEELINELKNAGVDIDMIRIAIEDEQEKGKGAK